MTHGSPEFDRKAFWEGKILGWEHGRYDIAGPARGLLERMADHASASLRFRLDIAASLLAPHVEGQHVLDLGCGSGRLATALLQAGATRYTGVDIAEAAIEAGRARALDEGWGDRARFICGGLDTLDGIDADLVVSLGLTDWLDDEELSRLVRAGTDCLHAISERRASPTQWLHRAYVHLAYGRRSLGYVPRYLSVDALEVLADRPLTAWRHPRLSFGALVTTLDLAPRGTPTSA